MQRLKYTTAILFCLALISGASAQEVKITPNNYNINLDAGETYTQDIQVKWTGESPVVASLFTNVTTKGENGNGFNITYEKQRFILVPGQPINNEIVFNTSKRLKPTKYSFITESRVQVPVEVKRSSDTDYVVSEETVYVNNTNMSEDKINQLMEDLEQARNKLRDEDKRRQELERDKRELQERVQRLKEETSKLEKRLKNSSPGSNKDEQKQKTSLAAWIAILWSILVTGIFGYSNRNKIKTWIDNRQSKDNEATEE